MEVRATVEVGNSSDRARRRGSETGRGWRTTNGGDSSQRSALVTGSPGTGGIIYTVIFVRGISFSPVQMRRAVTRSGARQKERRGHGGRRDLIARHSRSTMSETVMSAIEQLGGVIKIEKKKKTIYIRARTR